MESFLPIECNSPDCQSTKDRFAKEIYYLKSLIDQISKAKTIEEVKEILKPKQCSKEERDQIIKNMFKPQNNERTINS